jgi:hypothetical protein
MLKRVYAKVIWDNDDGDKIEAIVIDRNEIWEQVKEENPSEQDLDSLAFMLKDMILTGLNAEHLQTQCYKMDNIYCFRVVENISQAKH